jgi:hypothetical protein
MFGAWVWLPLAVVFRRNVAKQLIGLGQRVRAWYRGRL